jgi:hypothetical protein
MACICIDKNECMYEESELVGSSVSRVCAEWLGGSSISSVHIRRAATCRVSSVFSWDNNVSVCHFSVCSHLHLLQLSKVYRQISQQA